MPIIEAKRDTYLNLSKVTTTGLDPDTSGPDNCSWEVQFLLMFLNVLFLKILLIYAFSFWRYWWKWSKQCSIFAIKHASFLFVSSPRWPNKFIPRWNCSAVQWANDSFWNVENDSLSQCSRSSKSTRHAAQRKLVMGKCFSFAAAVAWAITICSLSLSLFLSLSLSLSLPMTDDSRVIV